MRELPSVDRLATELDAPHRIAVAIARRVIAAHRAELEAGGDASVDLLAAARAALARATAPSLRRVLNATGVLLHTNLGRAPLAASAREAVARAAEGYVNLELDLEGGRRGSRQAHVAPLLRELTGAPDALAVNNGAGAALLAVAALAGPGAAVIVSRGELVEIGGGFRIPEVVEQAGAKLLEVGTTNRTRLADYERALDRLAGAPAVVLRVHRSNFRTVGFVESVAIERLCGLGVPVIDDLGSGALADAPALADEPSVRRSLEAGVALACFSGDKLLGGPQAGILVGETAAIGSARRNPLARALRIDKLSLAALEATLALYREPSVAWAELPVLAGLTAGDAALTARAKAIAAPLAGRAEIIRASAAVGGGTLPLLELEGPVVAVDPAPRSVDGLAAALRALEPPVIGRIRQGRLLLDPRTLTDAESRAVGALVASVWEGPTGEG